MAPSDDARRKILERRAVFVAATMAAATAGCEEKPQACLTAAAEEFLDAGAADASVAGASSSEGPTAHDASPRPCLEPIPCLSPPPPPPPRDAGPMPRPCLKVAWPRDAGAPEPCLKFRPPDAR